MEENSYKFPTEQVPLPSKGLLYPPTSALASGKIEMKYGTAFQEDILTNQNFIKQGIVIDKLLQSMIVDKINYDDLLIGDKNALIVAARILMYGKDYKFSISDPNDKKNIIPITVDLTQIEEKIVDESLITPNINEFSFTLPSNGQEVKFKLLSIKDEKAVEAEINGLKKATNNSTEITTRLKHTIISVAGNRTSQVVRETVDRLLSADSRALRNYISKVQPDVKLSFQHDLGKGIEEVPIPITIDFFWPSAE